MDAIIVEPFIREFAACPARRFFEEYLLKYCAPKQIVVGHDFTFGHRRSGTVTQLSHWCAAANIECEIVPPLFHEELLISSTYIRNCISSGDLNASNSALGHPYSLIGPIVQGRGIGRQLGFPTLNLLPENEIIPPAGVYISRTHLDNIESPAINSATYVGLKPTFGGTTLVVETFLLTTPAELRPQRLSVDLLLNLRGDINFPSAEALKAQISRDVEAIRQWHQDHPLEQQATI